MSVEHRRYTLVVCTVCGEQVSNACPRHPDAKLHEIAFTAEWEHDTLKYGLDRGCVRIGPWFEIVDGRR